VLFLTTKGQGKVVPIKGLQLKPKYNLLKNNGWMVPNEVMAKIPKELGQPKIADKKIGLRWFDSKGDKAIRIMKGDKNAEFSHQQVDYVQIRSGGQVVLKDGTKTNKPITGDELRKLKDAHIPYEEWINWRSWDKP
jgi:hypothetical protein